MGHARSGAGDAGGSIADEGACGLEEAYASALGWRVACGVRRSAVAAAVQHVAGRAARRLAAATPRIDAGQAGGGLQGAALARALRGDHIK